MEKELYDQPECEIIYFETADVVTASAGGEDPLPDVDL